MKASILLTMAMLVGCSGPLWMGQPRDSVEYFLAREPHKIANHTYWCVYDMYGNVQVYRARFDGDGLAEDVSYKDFGLIGCVDALMIWDRQLKEEEEA